MSLSSSQVSILGIMRDSDPHTTEELELETGESSYNILESLNSLKRQGYIDSLSGRAYSSRGTGYTQKWIITDLGMEFIENLTFRTLGDF